MEFVAARGAASTSDEARWLKKRLDGRSAICSGRRKSVRLRRPAVHRVHFTRYLFCRARHRAPRHSTCVACDSCRGTRRGCRCLAATSSTARAASSTIKIGARVPAVAATRVLCPVCGTDLNAVAHRVVAKAIASRFTYFQALARTSAQTNIALDCCCPPVHRPERLPRFYTCDT